MAEDTGVTASERPGGVPLASVAALTTLAWIWDVSRHATFGEAGPWELPRILAVAGCLAWAAVLWRGEDARLARLTGSILGAALAVGAPLLALWSLGGNGSGRGYFSPPTLALSLALGALAVLTLMVHAQRTRGASGRGHGPLVVHGGLVLLWLSVMTADYTAWPNLWRGTEFLLVAGGALALPLAFLARTGPGPWSATAAALACNLFLVLSWAFLYWVPVSGFSGLAAPERFVLPAGPLLLALPALATDWLQGRSWPPATLMGDTLRAVALGSAFILVLWAGHWFWAEVFVNLAGSGRDLAALWWPGTPLEGDWTHRYWTLDPGRRRWVLGMAGAVVLATLSARLGLWLGSWLVIHSKTP